MWLPPGLSSKQILTKEKKCNVYCRPLGENFMLRIAVLGCGRIGRMHAANIAAHPRAALAGVFDVHEPAGDEVAEHLGVRKFPSVAAVFASSDVDAVLIATSTPTHADLVEQAVAAGKPVLCEKPIDLSFARVEACAQKIAGAATPIMLGFVRRFDAGHRAVRDAVRAVASATLDADDAVVFRQQAARLPPRFQDTARMLNQRDQFIGQRRRTTPEHNGRHPVHKTLAQWRKK
jgi:Oxidoreductase family, NAD-binding Rossmann fold